MGEHHDFVLAGWRTITRAELNLCMGGAATPRFPIDLDPWAFYPLPVLCQEGFIIGNHKSDTTLNTSRFMLPHVDPSRLDNPNVASLFLFYLTLGTSSSLRHRTFSTAFLERVFRATRDKDRRSERYGDSAEADPDGPLRKGRKK